MSAPNEFSLKCRDEGFLKRQENAFGQLFEIEKQRKANQEEPMETDGQSFSKSNLKEIKAQRSYTKTFRREKSIFKVPYDTVPKHFLKRLPDFKKNPHKWTKYSLDDVKDEDISEKGNTKAALSFLKELSVRNDKNIMENQDNDQELPKKIVFQRPILNNETTGVTTEESVSFRGSKIVMPEYVIGQKVKKDRKNRIKKSKEDHQMVKLNHLFAEDHQE
ncbi:hypothetical protein WA026_022291 [Henosepilachna vigintioctopunctata]|uniref:U5 small nuclear ribonucleoprotein TSSC4 n=1 Tax=Henosepilachna vigintioctopunctata TaxID=420089 RepID=A0AAW1VJH9_9CUCU